MRKRSGLFMVAGAALLLAAASWKAYYLWEDYTAGQNAGAIMEQLLEGGPAQNSSEVSGVPLEPWPEAVGVLTVPSLELELPVLGECTEELLKLSVCVYSGEIAGTGPRRLVISGHNYKSHFRDIPLLPPGSEIYFTGLAGGEYRLAVASVEQIAAGDFEALEAGDWDITLFTCNFDNSKRILVRCAIVA